MSFYDDYHLYDEYAPMRYAKVMEAAQSDHLYAVPIISENWVSYVREERLYYILLRNGRYTMYVPPTREEIEAWMNRQA